MADNCCKKIQQCAAILLVLGVAGTFFWSVFICIGLDQPCYRNDNPFMGMTYQTWEHWNGGIAIGPLILIGIVYVFRCFFAGAPVGRDNHYVYYAADGGSQQRHSASNSALNCLVIWALVYLLFETIWIIIGSILFFGYYLNEPCCNDKAKQILIFIFTYLHLILLSLFGRWVYKQQRKKD